MAEYQKVMKQHMRMCRYYREKNNTCNGCQIYEEDLEAICIGAPCVYIEKNLERVEKVVMEWAEEHKVIYPTWTEYFRETGIFKAGQGHEALDTLRMEPEIAEKLGVKPKEV